MKPFIFTTPTFTPNYEELAQKLRVKPRHPSAGALRTLLDEAVEIAQPKAIYKVAQVEDRAKDSVTIDGHLFKSRLLRAHLEDVHRVFPYIATCGRELYEWQMSLEDPLDQYYVDAISSFALKSVRDALLTHLETTYKLGQTAEMTPGSLDDLPLEAQPPLFSLLGNPEKSIGVELLESLLMVPGQTVSGIRFQSESSFESCQLCEMEDCPNRKAPFDATAMDEKLGKITE